MGYTTVAAVRTLEGLPAAPPAGDGPTDVQVQAAIDYASALIDMWCGQWFDARERTYLLDGTGESMLILPEAPIIAISSIKELDELGNVVQTYAATSYIVYNRHLSGGPDDRRLPRVEYRQAGAYPNMWANQRWIGGKMVWPLGQQNLRVHGWFGYRDFLISSITGMTPLAIERICRLLVLRYAWPTYSHGDVAEEAMSRGRMQSERTRDQSWSVAWPWDASTMGATGIGAWTGDPEIDRVLLTYQVGIAQGMAFV